MLRQFRRFWGDFLAHNFNLPKVSCFSSVVLFSPLGVASGQGGACADVWTATSTTSAPTARSDHSAIWTGSEMIVWGGLDTVTIVNSGGRYNPTTDSWTATSTADAPAARSYHAAIWTGNEMILWAGHDRI